MPSNILLDEHGQAWVTDFGMARLVVPAESPQVWNSVGGTPAFMAPEQLDDGMGSVGIAVDIDGIEGILYFALAGRPPHAPESPLEPIEDLPAQPVPALRNLDHRAAQQRGDIYMQCLQFEPQARFDRVAELRDALRSLEAK